MCSVYHFMLVIIYICSVVVQLWSGPTQKVMMTLYDYLKAKEIQVID